MIMTHTMFKLVVTDIAMKIDGEWHLDKYPRLYDSTKCDADEYFIETFMSDYSGNGIEDIKILETQYIGSYNMISIIEGAFKDDLKDIDNLNVTLDY